MSIQEKRSLVFLISQILVSGLYSLFIYNRYHDTIISNPNDFIFWGKTFFILIPVSIVATIIIQIVFTILNKIITNEDFPTITDERDKLIELKAVQVSHWMFTIGFLLSMGSQAIGMQPWVMFITLFASGLLSSVASEITKFYLYRKGL